MAYIFVEDFKLGMDTRKARVAGTPGSLWDLKNGLINRGGEIEGRKSLVSTYTLPAGTFGCHSLASELFVFGSGADPGVPVGTIYQQLAHSDGSTAMSRLLRAENFDGKIYAIAEFEDDSVFHYFNGQRITSWDGIAVSVIDNESVARSLSLLVDRSISPRVRPAELSRSRQPRLAPHTPSPRSP